MNDFLKKKNDSGFNNCNRGWSKYSFSYPNDYRECKQIWIITTSSIRGRVARGNLQSHCILIHNQNLSENSKKRLVILKNSNDGFEIAEKDLFLRGSGDFFGTNQSGLPKWRVFYTL